MAKHSGSTGVAFPCDIPVLMKVSVQELAPRRARVSPARVGQPLLDNNVVLFEVDACLPIYLDE